jgi:hypothetical protein
MPPQDPKTPPELDSMSPELFDDILRGLLHPTLEDVGTIATDGSGLATETLVAQYKTHSSILRSSHRIHALGRKFMNDDRWVIVEINNIGVSLL